MKSGSGSGQNGLIQDDGVGFGNRFPKDSRLTEAELYGRVFKKPYRVKGQYLLVLARPNDGAASRLGMAIAKKKIRKAVGRNRIKRLIRESFRVTKRRLPSVDLVIMANPGANQASNTQLVAELDGHWASVIRKFAATDDDQGKD